MAQSKKPSARGEIVRRLTHRLFEGRLIQNSVRGDYVEEMIAMALEPAWRLCSGDWYGWDFENAAGARIQVKQSAAKQTWGGRPYWGEYDIKPATGYYLNGTDWIDRPGRPSDIYIFAWHPVTDESCDHGEPEQWRFFVVPESELPPSQARIRRSVLEKEWCACGFGGLAERVSRVSSAVPAPKLKTSEI